MNVINFIIRNILICLKPVLLLLLSHFSRVRLCNPIDGSPPGFPVPGILQARTLEWVAISFSNAWKWSRSVVSDSSRPHGLQPTRLLCPWDFPGRRTGVGCHCLLWFKACKQCLIIIIFVVQFINKLPLISLSLTNSYSLYVFSSIEVKVASSQHYLIW